MSSSSAPGPRGTAPGSAAREGSARATTGQLVVHVIPRSKRTEVAGLHGDAVRIRIAAPPVDGAANAELVRFLAERLGVPRRDIAITAGASGRSKTVAVAGLSAEEARRKLLTLMADR